MRNAWRKFERLTEPAQYATRNQKQKKPGVEWVQALTDISRSGYIGTARKPVHRLQIRPIVHN